MTLAGTYVVYGYIYNEDGSAANGATVTIVDVTTNQGTETATTDTNGVYQINIQGIASDGDDILVEAMLSTGYVYGECFTLDLYESPKNIDITVEEYKYLEILSDTYSSKLRFCTIQELDRSISKNIDVLNFWVGDISAVDRDINNEPLNFSGIEYAKTAKEICYMAKKFERIWDIMDDNEEITISDFNTCYDGVYIVKDFNINTIKRCPNAYLWKIDLEYVRSV